MKAEPTADQLAAGPLAGRPASQQGEPVHRNQNQPPIHKLDGEIPLGNGSGPRPRLNADVSHGRLSTASHDSAPPVYYVALLARGKALTVLPPYRIQPELRNGSTLADVHVGSLVRTFAGEHEEPVAVGAEHGGAHCRPNVLSFCRTRRTASAHEGAWRRITGPRLWPGSRLDAGYSRLSIETPNRPGWLPAGEDAIPTGRMSSTRLRRLSTGASRRAPPEHRRCPAWQPGCLR